MLSIRATALFTCSTPPACSREASAISAMSLSTSRVLAAIRAKEAATWALIRTPPSLLARALPIFAAVSFALWALRHARLRTSSATTANPMPASPARAASTAALSASKFV